MPAIGFFGLGLVVWLSLLHQQRTLVNHYHTWARADLRLRRAAEQLTRRTQIVINDDWIVALLNQAGFDAIGQDPGIDQVDRILLDPIPAIVGLGRDFQRVVFTPAPASIAQRLIQRQTLINLIGGSPRGIRIYNIDALQGDVFVADDLAAAYHYLDCCVLLNRKRIVMLGQAPAVWQITGQKWPGLSGRVEVGRARAG